jgi:DNA-binding beta-propeller fold protein YncE
MALRFLGHIELPEHRAKGGFDHADIHHPTDRLYVAHTSNDSIDVIDCARDRYIASIPGLMGVAGALVSETRNLVFTSNRGENTVSVFAPGDEPNAFKIAVGVKPNGLAFDPTRRILIAANVGDPSIAGFVFSIGRGPRETRTDRRSQSPRPHALGGLRRGA